MAKKKKNRQAKKTFRFQLTLGGIIGIGVVCLCLFLWMFLLGIWAGQTILLPSAPSVESGQKTDSASGENSPPVQILGPEGKKKLAR